jgi:hypothetical protein
MADTGINSASQTKMYISANPHDIAFDAMTDSAALTAYEALTGWKEIESVEDYGTFGTNFEAITFDDASSGLRYKFKGINDNGTLALRVGKRSGAQGQAKVESVSKLLQAYDFKIELSDRLNVGFSSGTVFYFAGKVMSYNNEIGSANNIIRAAVNISIDGRVLQKAPVASA